MTSSTNKEKRNIKNLDEFDSFRTHCPFCQHELKLKVWLRNRYEISLQADQDWLILTYDGVDASLMIIGSYIKHIFINRFSNEMQFRQQADFIFDAIDIGSALKNNSFRFSKKCENCYFAYNIEAGAMLADSINITTFLPHIASERFSLSNNQFNIPTSSVINYYDDELTALWNNDAKCLKLIEFDWTNTESIIKTANMLLTFI